MTVLIISWRCSRKAQSITQSIPVKLIGLILRSKASFVRSLHSSWTAKIKIMKTSSERALTLIMRSNCHREIWMNPSVTLSSWTYHSSNRNSKSIFVRIHQLHTVRSKSRRLDLRATGTAWAPRNIHKTRVFTKDHWLHDLTRTRTNLSCTFRRVLQPGRGRRKRTRLVRALMTKPRRWTTPSEEARGTTPTRRSDSTDPHPTMTDSSTRIPKPSVRWANSSRISTLVLSQAIKLTQLIKMHSSAGTRVKWRKARAKKANQKEVHNSGDQTAGPSSMISRRSLNFIRYTEVITLRSFTLLSSPELSLLEKEARNIGRFSGKWASMVQHPSLTSTTRTCSKVRSMIWTTHSEITRTRKSSTKMVRKKANRWLN